MAARVGATPNVPSPTGQSRPDIEALSRTIFYDSTELRARLRDMFPKDGSERMAAPAPMQILATASLPAASLWEGSIVFDTTLNLLAYSDGTNWRYISAGAGGLSQPPAFRAHKGGTDQTGLVDNTQTSVTFGTEVYDIGAFYASNTWTPPAGLVAVCCGMLVTGDMPVGNRVEVIIRKNGGNFAQVRSGAFVSNQASAEVYIEDRADGDDTYNVQALIDVASSTGTIIGATDTTWFAGHWIGP